VLPHKDIINVLCKDGEHFPVMRKLLRPCISLTSVVQLGRGIYRENNQKKYNDSENNNGINDNDNGNNNDDGNNHDKNDNKNNFNGNNYDSKKIDDYIRNFINNNNDKHTIDGINDMYNEDNINFNDKDFHHAVNNYDRDINNNDEKINNNDKDSLYNVDDHANNGASIRCVFIDERVYIHVFMYICVCSPIDSLIDERFYIFVHSGNECGDEMENTIKIDVDSCTFDKVLLYLEHEVNSCKKFYDKFLI
jgi:hypothetical protein